MNQSSFTKPKVVKYDDLDKPWYVYFRYQGRKFVYKKGINYIKSYNKRLAEANALAAALHEKLKSGWNPLLVEPNVGSDMTLIEAIDFGLEKKRQNVSEKTYLGYRCSIGFIKNAAIALYMQHALICDIKRVHVKMLLEKAKEQRKASNYAYNKYLDHFRAVLSELIQWDIIAINPANNIKNLPVAESSANVPATPEQHKIIKQHLQSLHPDFYNFVVTIFHTGIRPEEILKIRLSMVNLCANQIILPPEITKTNRERIVPINRHLMEVFKSMNFEALPKDYYLFGSFRDPGTGNTGPKRDFIPGPTKIKRDTATKRWQKIVKIGLKMPTVNLYSNKHAGANAKILAGIELSALQELYGHSSKLMTTRYATVVKEVYRKQIMDSSPDF